MNKIKKEEFDTNGLEYIIHNIHCHIFTIDYLPKNFIGWYMPTTLIRKKWIAKLLFKLVNSFAPRIRSFLYSAIKEDQYDIFNELRSYYPKSAKFCPLTIDFEYMKAGKCSKGFEQQLEDVLELKKYYEAKDLNTCYPFIGVDPRRKELLKLIKKYFEVHNFSGIKLYPALGFFPDDERLMPIYEYAEKNQIPITTHCIPKNKNHFRYRPTKAMVEKAKGRFNFFKAKDAEKAYDFAKYLNHPENYRHVLKRFPKLKINLAHFGGNEEWNKYLDVSDENFEDERNWYSIIRKMLVEFENVYADISFTVYDDRLYPLLRNLLRTPQTKNKVLFGSDFYMLQKDYSERRFGIDVRGYLEDEEFWLIAEKNPKKFLKTNLKPKRNDIQC